MALSLDERDLMREVLASARARDARLEGIQAMLDKFPGSWWDGVPADANFDPENAGFELVSYLQTQLVWDNPHTSVTTHRGGPAQAVAEAMHWGLNRWILDSDLKTTLKDLVVDYLYGWSIAHVTLAPKTENFEMEDPPLWPQVSRISTRRFGWDHLCPTWRQARILWHEWWADKDDMIERARLDRKRPEADREGWNLDAIEGLSTTSTGAALLGAMSRDGGEISVDRKQQRFVTCYLPGRRLDGEPGPEQGFNGVLVTLGCSANGGSPSSGVIVCPPRMAFAPRWGPYVIGGTYVVPDSPHPLSVILANAGHIEQASRSGKAISRAIESYAKIVVTTDAQLAEMIVNGRHNGVYTSSSLADLAGRLVSLEKGGPTGPMLEGDALIRSRRDRALGMDDVQRGVVTGSGTATEVATASQAAGARVDAIKQGFHDFTRRCLKTVAYYLFSTDEISFAAGREATEVMRERLASQGIVVPEGAEAFFDGGSFVAGSGVTFDDLQLEIEPYSMERPSDQTKVLRASFYTNVLPGLAQALPQLVAAGWKPKPLLRALGEAYAIPNLDQEIDMAKLMEASENPVAGEDPMPRLLRDIGLVHSQAGRMFARPAGGERSAGGVGAPMSGPSERAGAPLVRPAQAAPVATAG